MVKANCEALVTESITTGVVEVIHCEVMVSRPRYPQQATERSVVIAHEVRSPTAMPSAGTPATGPGPHGVLQLVQPGRPTLPSFPAPQHHTIVPARPQACW